MLPIDLIKTWRLIIWAMKNYPLPRTTDKYKPSLNVEVIMYCFHVLCLDLLNGNCFHPIFSVVFFYLLLLLMVIKYI